MMLANDYFPEMLPNDSLMNADKFANSCCCSCCCGIGAHLYQMYTFIFNDEINEKKLLLETLKQRTDQVVLAFEQNNQVLFLKNDLERSIMTKKLNLKYVQEELELKEWKIKKSKEDMKLLRDRIAKKKQLLRTYTDKIEKCKEMVKRSENVTLSKLNSEKDGFNMLKLRIIEKEKERIEEINRIIFDLSEIKQQKEEDVLQKSTRTALKDARQTVYVNGRWILSNDHVIYRLVRSILPSDGDYMTFYRDYKQKDDKIKDVQLDDLDRPLSGNNRLPSGNVLTASTSSNSVNASSSIDRRTILSGLSYTVQFVNLVAYYLNILLPYNIPHSKFCTQSLNDDQFQNAVAKLNTNIVYLSINQHIPVTNLLPKHTLENLNHFLTYFKEMRVKLREKHSICFPNHLIPLLDEMFNESEDDSIMQDSVPNLIFNDYDEWEAVPNSNEIPSDDTIQMNTNSNAPNNNYLSNIGSINNALNPNSIRHVSTSLISSVLSQFWYKNQQPK